MTRDEIRSAVLKALSRIAPEADMGKLRPDDDLREALDIDSMDVNRFALLLQSSLHVDVPEKDYAKLLTLRSAVEELAARLTSA